jgi:hypothetical protein
MLSIIKKLYAWYLKLREKFTDFVFTPLFFFWHFYVIPQFPIFFRDNAAVARGLFYGGAWFVSETVFRSCLITTPAGKLIFSPRLQFAEFLMTFGAFFAGLLFLENVYKYVRPFQQTWSNRLLRYLICYPIAIWLFELSYGSFIYYFGNQLRAWHYHGSWALFNNMIDLGYYPIWVIFGVCLDFLACVMWYAGLLTKPGDA